MNRHASSLRLLRCGLALCLALTQQTAFAHGGVVLEADLCVIKIGYLKAHFKIYLPRTRQHEEFCEDLPEAGEGVFVMEYLHSSLGEMPIEFRIIKNVTGQGRFTNSQDVARIDDIEKATVLFHAPRVQPDVFTVLHHFDDPGEYVGIVTIRQSDTNTVYTAVFPFQVGFTGFGYWPLFAALAILLHVNYLWMSGWFSRRRKKRSRPSTVVPEVGHG